MAPISVTDETFQQVVLDAPLPVLVDFWATWCTPCRAVAPVLQALSEELADQLQIAKVDVDQCPRTAATYRIQSIPTLMLFVSGKPVQAVQGALSREALEGLLGEWLPELAGPKITVTELSKKLEADESARLFDLLRPQDFERSHLKAAECVAPDELESKLRETSGQTQVVLICRTGKDSLEQAKRAKKLGYPNVFALENGLLEWEGAGKPTYSTVEEQRGSASDS